MTEFLDQKRPTFPVYITIGLTIIFFAITEIIFRNLFPLFLNIPLTLMCLIYWNMALPKSVGLTWAILCGFILDLSQNLILGSNVMILIQRYFHRLRALYRVQQSLIVAGMVFTYQMIFIFSFLNFSNEILIELLLFTIISALIWPVIFGLLRFIRIKFTYIN